VTDHPGKYAQAGNARPPHWSPPKLTSRQRTEISHRLADGETPRALALEYRVSTDTIRRYR